MKTFTHFWDKQLILIPSQFTLIAMITLFHTITPLLCPSINILCNCHDDLDDITLSVISTESFPAYHTVEHMVKNVFMNALYVQKCQFLINNYSEVAFNGVQLTVIIITRSCNKFFKEFDMIYRVISGKASADYFVNFIFGNNQWKFSLCTKICSFMNCLWKLRAIHSHSYINANNVLGCW